MTERTPTTVLVVDDEVDTCHNLADILTDLGYDVDTASSGAAALDLARQKSYDVVLLDLKMPGMDGLTLYRHVRRIQPSTVAVIVTAYASEAAMRDAMNAGAWDVVAKPVDLGQLLRLVDDAVQQPLILVVDDDESLCDSLWDLLHERRVRVALAHSEQEAIHSLETRTYQVVLVDLKLPGGDGRAVLSALQRLSPESHTILITGYPDEFGDIIESAIGHGADAVCYKPFNLQQLLSTVDQLTERRADEG